MRRRPFARFDEQHQERENRVRARKAQLDRAVRIVRFLEQTSEPIYAEQVARRFGFEPRAVSWLLDYMEQNGILESWRTRSPGGGRYRRYYRLR